MTQYRCAVNEGLPHDRRDHRRRSPQVLMPGFLMLTLLGSAFVPLTARAAEPPDPLCTNCHNVDGNSTNPEYPKLAGLDAWYIAKQIRDFKNEKRLSEVMGPMAEKISEADIGKLAAYYSGQKRTPGIVTDRSLAAQGQAIYDDGVDSTAVPACAGCHEKDGSGSAKFPRIAGQHTAYLINQLNNFRTGVRNNEPRMRSVVRRLTDQEITAVAEYIAGLKGGEK